MKTLILNLGQILVDVKMWHSRLAFLKLLNCNCCSLWTKYAAIQSTIDDYKLGRIDTEKFLSRLEKESDIEMEGLKLMIKEAWNAMLKVDKQKFDDLLQVMQQHPDYAVCLINNTNPLHFEFIVAELQRHYGRQFSMEARANVYYLKFNVSREIIIPVYLSFSMRQYKANGLLGDLLHHARLNSAETLLISPYQPEITVAKELGMKFHRWQLGWTRWDSDALPQLAQIVENKMGVSVNSFMP